MNILLGGKSTIEPVIEEAGVYFASGSVVLQKNILQMRNFRFRYKRYRR